MSQCWFARKSQKGGLKKAPEPYYAVGNDKNNCHINFLKICEQIRL